jgi:hypothetical protein
MVTIDLSEEQATGMPRAIAGFGRSSGSNGDQLSQNVAFSGQTSSTGDAS